MGGIRKSKNKGMSADGFDTVSAGARGSSRKAVAAMRLFALPIAFTICTVLFSMSPDVWSAPVEFGQGHHVDALWWQKMEYEEAFAVNSKITLLDRLQAEKSITQSTYDAEVVRLVKDVSEIVSRPVTIEEIRAAVMEKGLTVMQRVRGLFSFTTLIWVFAIIAGTIAFSFIFYYFIWPLLKLILLIPYEVWECCAYAISYVTILKSYHSSDDIGQFIGLTGLCMFVASFFITMVLTGKRFGSSGDNLLKVMMVALPLLLINIGALTVLYQSRLLAVVSFVVLMVSIMLNIDQILRGFLCGWTDNDRSFFLLIFTTAATVIVPSLALTAYSARELSAGDEAVGVVLKNMALFAPAGLWCASNVVGITMMFYGSRYVYERNSSYFLVRNIGVSLVFAALLFFAHLLHIDSMQGVVGTWLIFYILQKWCEIPYGSPVTFMTFGMFGLCVLLYGVSWFLRSHPEFVIGLF